LKYQLGGAVGEMAKDPICGMNVNDKTTKFRSEHEGVSFYFCSAGCKNTFDRDPHRYAHKS
jgi:Cu+-exporting ATPase